MSILIEQLKQVADMTKNSNMGAFYAKKLADAKQVKVEPMSAVLEPYQIAAIKRIDLKPKQCYRNAFLVAQLLGCKYVEGQMLIHFGIDHAFNKIGDRYIDVTKELVLKELPTNTEYIAIGEYSWQKAQEIFIETKTYTDVYNHLYAKSLK